MRIATYNVHGWVDPDGRTNPARVARLLAALDCDVVALQEVTSGYGFRVRDYDDEDFDGEGDEDFDGEGDEDDDGGRLRSPEAARVARALGMRAIEAPAGWGANILLLREAPSARAAVWLGRGRSEARSAALATVPTPWGPVVFCATHLDHLDESTRVRQLGEIADALGGRDAVVLGDFNALRASDYPPARLAQIRRERARNGIDPPAGDVVRAADALGWVDLVRLGVAGRHAAYRASLRAPLPAELAVTSYFGTRVDYVWATAALATRLHVPEVRVVEADASDHSAVVVTLAPLPPGVRANPGAPRPAPGGLVAFLAGRGAARGDCVPPDDALLGDPRSALELGRRRGGQP